MSNSYCNALCRGDTQDEVARSRSLRGPNRSSEKKRHKTGFPEGLNEGQLGEYSIALAYDPQRSSFQQCRSSKNQCTSAQLHRLHTGSTQMSCLGIDVSSTVQGSELDHITVEGIEATDALGRAICQSQLTVCCENVAPLNLDLKLSPDDLEPVFSGAAWAGTVLWRAAA